jgi:hypothetical protein
LPSRATNLLTADYLWSIALYTAVIIALIGGYGLFRPLRRVHRGRRTHAATMLIVGLVAIYLISRAMPRAMSTDAAPAEPSIAGTP